MIISITKACIIIIYIKYLCVAFVKLSNIIRNRSSSPSKLIRLIVFSVERILDTQRDLQSRINWIYCMIHSLSFKQALDFPVNDKIISKQCNFSQFMHTIQKLQHTSLILIKLK